MTHFFMCARMFHIYFTSAYSEQPAEYKQSFFYFSPLPPQEGQGEDSPLPPEVGQGEVSPLPPQVGQGEVSPLPSGEGQG